MHAEHFKEWLEYHLAAYPSLRDWFGMQSPDTTEHWRRALDFVTLEECKAATDAIFSGDLEAPKGYSDHPRAIRAAISHLRNREAPRYLDGERTYRCGTCRDSGIVTVFAESAIAVVQGLEGCERATAAVACRCVRGERFSDPKPYSNGRQPKKLRRLSGRDVLATGDWPADLDNLRAKHGYAEPEPENLTEGEQNAPEFEFSEPYPTNEPFE